MNARLKKLRKSLGLNQEEMAAALGVGQSTYSQFETGAKPIRSVYVEVLRSMYNANPDWLYTGEGDMFIKSSRDEEFLAAYEGLTEESKKLIFDLIMKLKQADE